MTVRHFLLCQESNTYFVMKKPKVFCFLVLNPNLKHCISKLSLYPLSLTICKAGKRLKVIDGLEHD